MAAFSTTTLSNGHTLTVVDVPFRAARVEERNELGTFLQVAYSARNVDDAQRWVDRAAERGCSAVGCGHDHRTTTVSAQ